VSARDDGGPAFPSHGTMGEVAHEGATLRDYFAAHALMGLFANASISEAFYREGKHVGDWYEQQAFASADAMLKARAAS
jgi:hypothetical protein